MIGGKSTSFFLAVDQFTFELDVEDAAAALNHFGVYIKFFLDRVRQTGGLRGIISLNAVFDGNMHRWFSLSTLVSACYFEAW